MNEKIVEYCLDVVIGVNVVYIGYVRFVIFEFYNGVVFFWSGIVVEYI